MTHGAHDEAEGEVIGVILLVAIVMILAVFVLFGSGPLADEAQEPTPKVGFRADDENRTLAVIQAPPGMTWGELGPGGDCAFEAPPPASAIRARQVVATNCGKGDTLFVVHRASGTALFEHEY